MYIVIGSGPAAISATKALVSQGHQVTILDVGTTLDGDRRKIVDRMSGLDPEDWNQEDLASIVGLRKPGEEAVHSKLSYGSSYSFDTRSSAVGVRWSGAPGFNHSLAKGGLSNVWGSSLLAYRQEDISDWPIRVDDLEPHYRAVLEFVPCTAIEDDLEEILPSYSSQSNPLKPSLQGEALLADLGMRRETLRKSGILFGRSRLAIHATGENVRSECVYCALCLSGCPYGLIYSSADTLDELIKSGSVKYLREHLVEEFQQVGDEVLVTGRNLADQTRFSHRARRVFVGAGVLPTAKIVLNSLKAFDTPVRLLDSQYFIYPLLRFSATPGIESERMHTTSQAFLEVDDPRVSPHMVHLQVYGYSTFLHQELNRTFLKWPLRSAAFRRGFLGRLMIAQGFVHSNESGSIELTLKKDPNDNTFLHVRICDRWRGLATILRVGIKLLIQSFRTKTIPLIPGLQLPNPGSGYHSGGTFPMKTDPGPLDTDTLGRLPSTDRVHLVDASVLPSVPATSITFTVMANAHRIASLAGKLDHS
jgi:choline dehydrogenase-like flavoprotein